MIISEFISQDFQNNIQYGSFSCSAPSNIALVKYWGKKDFQIPANPSISFTLNNCKTITTIDFTKKTNLDSDYSFEVFLDGEKKDSFVPKIEKFFQRIEVYVPFIKNYHFTINTSNTFPHSSGIASSASGMAAIANILLSIEKLHNPNLSQDYLDKKASFLARLGSGSACRSLKGKIVSWGKHVDIPESSDLYGTAIQNEIHPIFMDYQDTILLVDKGEKQVSSTVGHDLMHNHPYAEKRFEQAHQNLSKILSVLQNGDTNQFIEIVESEALTLHAMMMTSLPYFILMKPNTLQIINEIWNFRKQTNIPVCFTLDAGANVHVLYPKNNSNEVLKFISGRLIQYCQNQQYICDEIGNGAEQLIIKNN